jgi:penicillin-binding protein 1B
MRKKILISVPLAFLITICVGVIVTYLQVRDKIDQGLKNRGFLPPTEIWSAATPISIKEPLSQEKVIREFRIRGWTELKINLTRLVPQAPNTFGILEAADCQQLLFPGEITPQQGLEGNCVWGQFAELVVMYWSGNGLQIYADSQGFWKPIEHIDLSPVLIAQYLGNEPIWQDYKELGEIPTNCLNAVLAIEDSRFLTHPGVSFAGLARAVLVNTFAGRAAQGGSTITQQMVKNYFLTPERTLKRKLNEFIISLALEQSTSKDKILETYLNIIYLGQSGVYQVRGFPAASQYYFQRPVEELNLSQCATLAAILNNPGLYDPFKNPERTQKRRDLVLERMLAENFIEEPEKVRAIEAPLNVRLRPNIGDSTPYYGDQVRQDLIRLGLTEPGLKIQTGLQIGLQEIAQKTLQTQLNFLESNNKKIIQQKQKGYNLEALLIQVDNLTGDITALVGGRDFRRSQFNRALQAHRQVGSLIKPFVYYSAIHSGQFNPETTLSDEQLRLKVNKKIWSPENYTREYLGSVPLYWALLQSLNTTAVKVGQQVGYASLFDLFKNFQFQSEFQPVPSLFLGAFEMYPMELLRLYVALANLGDLPLVSSIVKVTSPDGEVLYQKEKIRKNMMDPSAAAQVVKIMTYVFDYGTAKGSRKLGFTGEGAGKTGTTSDYKDAWFVGFDPNQTTLVWIGYDNNREHGLTGGSGALPIWVDFINQTKGQTLSKKQWQWPETLEMRSVTIPQHLSPGQENLFLLFSRE